MAKHSEMSTVTIAALWTTIATALLAGCSSSLASGGEQSPVNSGPTTQGTAPPAPPRVPAAAEWLSPGVQRSTSGPFLYVAAEAANEVLIYPESGYHRSPVGKITSGVSSPYGLYVDQSGNLYVANQSPPTVTVYAPGSTYPSATYSQDLVRPHYMVVDQYGDLFVSNAPLRGCGTATVVEYQPGSQNAYQTLHVPGYEADGIDLDQQGNLYVAYRFCGTRVGGIEKFAPGSSQGENLRIRDYEPQGLIVDNAGDILAVETVKWDSVAFIRAGKRYPEFRVKLPEGNVPVELAITSDQSRLFVSSYDGYVYVTNYPITASSTWTVEDQVSNTPQGIALSNGQTF
jgi:DNA-binding beta-propeller fold protein YncE